MDDVFMIYAEHEGWDSNAFIKDFERSECYFPPLNLEEGEQDTFLETRFRVEDDNNITYWLKNANEDGRCNVWRYQHFHSYSPFLQKRALVTACLKKVHNMASTVHHLYSKRVHMINLQNSAACNTHVVCLRRRRPIWLPPLANVCG